MIYYRFKNRFGRVFSTDKHSFALEYVNKYKPDLEVELNDTYNQREMSKEAFEMANGLRYCDYISEPIITTSHSLALETMLKRNNQSIILGKEKAIELDKVAFLLANGYPLKKPNKSLYQIVTTMFLDN